MIFGASSTHGNWDELGGWAERIRLNIIDKTIKNPKEFHGLVFNLGVPGDMTADVLNRIEPEIKARLFYPKTIILLSGGTNDSRIKFTTKKPIVSDEKFQDNQEKILNIVKKYTDKILFLGFNQVDEKITNPYHDDDYSFINERIKKFNDITKNIYKKNNVDFLDIFSMQKDLYDGLHPNSLGHKKIFEKIQPYINKYLSLI